MTKTIPGLRSPAEVQRLMGSRLKELRLLANLKRTTLADRSGVSARSLQRFEDTGEVSLKNLLRLVHVLGLLQEWERLLRPAEATTLAELEVRERKPVRRRGRI